MKNIEEFKVKGVGLDITNLKEYYAYSHESIGYIHTTLGSGNEFNSEELITKYIETSAKDFKFLVTVNSLSKDTETALKSLLSIYEINTIDLLFIDASCDLEKNADYINSIKASGIVENFGISNPKNLTELKKVAEIFNGLLLGSTLKYLSLPISPLYFDLEVIEWAEENNVSLFGFNPFGGHISSEAVIDSFSVPYLLGFSATYSDVVMISCRNDYDRAAQQAVYVGNLIGAKSDSKYILTKSTKKLYKPLNKLIYTSLSMDKNNIVSYSDPSLLSDPNDITLNFGCPVSQYSEPENDEYQEVVKRMNDFLTKCLTEEGVDDIKTRNTKEVNLILKKLVKTMLTSFIYMNKLYKVKKGDKIEVEISPREMTDTITLFKAQIKIIRKGWFGKETVVSEQIKPFMLICTDDKKEFRTISTDEVN